LLSTRDQPSSNRERNCLRQTAQQESKPKPTQTPNKATPATTHEDVVYKALPTTTNRQKPYSQHKKQHLPPQHTLPLSNVYFANNALVPP